MRNSGSDPAALARSRLRKASWFAAGAGALAIGVVLWSSLSRPPELKAPPLPEPNGFDDVLSASNAIQEAKFPDSQKLDVTTADAEALRPWVESNREAVATIREAIRRPFQAPVVYDLNLIVEQTNQAAPIRTFGARALYAEGRLALLDGRPDETASTFLDLLRLGNAMAANVPMMHYLAALAPQRLGLIGLRDVRDKLDADQLRAVIAELESIDAAAVPASSPVTLEFAFMEENVGKQMGTFASIPVRLSGMIEKQKAVAAESLEQAAKRIDAGRRLLLADLAVRLHQREKGEGPDDLKALTPSILKAPPIDPYTGRPVIYRKGGSPYSAGPDGDDDQTSPALGPKFRPGDDGDFTIDSF